MKDGYYIVVYKGVNEIAKYEDGFFSLPGDTYYYAYRDFDMVLKKIEI